MSRAKHPKPAQRPRSETVCEKCGSRHWLARKDGAPQCQAHSKARGRELGKPVQCEACAFPGSGTDKCGYHGGQSLRGAASPAFKHGRTSGFLPVRLQDGYTAAMEDPELLSLREQAAITHARIRDLFQRMAAKEGTGSAEQLNLAVESLEGAIASGNAKQAAEALKGIKAAAKAMQEEDRTWREIGRWQEQFRRLVDTERRRLEALQLYVTSERLTALAAAFVEIIRQNVSDKRQLNRIIQAIAQMIGEGKPSLPPTGTGGISG